MRYFGFAIADSMFPATCTVVRKPLEVQEVQEALKGKVEMCLNPSHGATIQAAKNRYNLPLTIPEKPPQVSLKSGDSVIVMAVRGLPRLTDRHEYTKEEIDKATFMFGEWSVS